MVNARFWGVSGVYTPLTPQNLGTSPPIPKEPKFFAYLSLVQLALIALAWFLNFAQDEASILLALAPALGFVAAFRSLSMMEEERPLARRKLGYLLQIFSATTAFIPFLILALQDQPP